MARKNSGEENTGLAAGGKIGKGKVSKAKTKDDGGDEGERAPRGLNVRYKVLVKENPFREGTIRHGFWDILTSCKTTAEAREQDARISSTFMHELAGKEIIELLDEA